MASRLSLRESLGLPTRVDAPAQTQKKKKLSGLPVGVGGGGGGRVSGVAPAANRRRTQVLSRPSSSAIGPARLALVCVCALSHPPTFLSLYSATSAPVCMVMVDTASQRKTLDNSVTSVGIYNLSPLSSPPPPPPPPCPTHTHSLPNLCHKETHNSKSRVLELLPFTH